ncbi:ATP-dependent RNA helicase SUPV3L1, mitochondrial [Strongylocentrotus purpuratus]|uniref:RNA helicase n=1 Tax=Strongylocentrotus purpuratus TaxID=7668 RepID=A0A7M7NTU9_STRPU|nr:ATP-dependent RNA helicase SUPV3L1, mitochondrial [Strongylocentrotus purpuratus]
MSVKYGRPYSLVRTFRCLSCAQRTLPAGAHTASSGTSDSPHALASAAVIHPVRCRTFSFAANLGACQQQRRQSLTLSPLSGIRRSFSDKDDKNVRALFIPVPVKTSNNPDDINIGEELGANLKNKKDDLMKILIKFSKRPAIQKLAEEEGLDDNLFHQSFTSFRKYIMEVESLEPDLHIVLSDILVGAGHIDDIFPYFIRHARQIFPALDCMEDLKKISDLTDPAQWYPEARAIDRKIIFHAGPTNSGKTYHALESYSQAKSGVYCGPLKLLASEVHKKTNERGIMCDLVTGEERKYAHPDSIPSSHVACTVEMTSVSQPYEVAVIDEIQMLRDPSRGWAWTRALLGVNAKEIHLCGEQAAIDLVKQLTLSTGDELEIREYKRLTPLQILDQPLDNLENVKPGDCIVAFSKNDLYSISRQLEAMGKECAVIYGSLPPGAKLSQAAKFNDPDDPCKILVATDAIGMGLNLSIKRVIFKSLIRPYINEKGEKEMHRLTTSQALQIAGRAGRFRTQFEEGEATTFHGDDLPLLKEILANPVEKIEAGGLHPTAEQIELFAYHLPDATLSNLIEIFINLSIVEKNYFVCNVDDFKFLADMIQHVPLHLRARYVFCCAPINRKLPFICTMFLKFARQYSRNQPITFDWFCRSVGWPLAVPKNIRDLMHLEAVHDVMDLYLWLSYRFMDMFPDTALIQDVQAELDHIIQMGVINITKLIRASETRSNGMTAIPDPDIEQKKSHGKIGDVTASKDKSEEGTEDGTNRRKTRDTKKEYLPHQRHQPLEGEGPSRDDLSQKLGGLSGRLSEELVKQGLLSKDMLEKLQVEWKEASLKSRLDFDRDGFNDGRRSEGTGRTGSSTKRKQTKQKK